MNNMLGGAGSVALASGKKMAAAWSRLAEAMSAEPELWLNVMAEAHRKQMQAATDLGAGKASQDAPVKDRRFASEQWHQNPFFSLMMQNYLTSGEALFAVIEKAKVSEEDKKLLRFAARQYVDAASPSNFPFTNPEVLAESARTGGQNFVEGMKNFAEDMQAGSISNTDKNAFAPEKNVAITPGSVILQNDVMQLIEYAPQTEKVHARPLLIVPPCINKYYILDLQPHNSFVAAAIAAGHRVFLISWKSAGESESNLTWDFYVREGVMAALDAVRAVSGAKDVNALGFCIGGTMLAQTLAALAHSGERPAHSLTLLATMLDFSDSGDIGIFIDEDHVQAQEARFAGGGVVDGGELARGFAALRPNDLIWPYFVDNYLRGQKPQAFDLLYWNSDSVNLPGPMFTEYLRATYLENRIAKGESVCCGAPVDLSALKMPSYIVACEKDHIVPWQAAFASAKLMGGDRRFVLSASGHIAGIINPPADKKRWHQIAPVGAKKEAKAASDSSPEVWRENVPVTQGSWWSDWHQWLAKQGGKKVAAPKKPGNMRHPPLQDAPGSYVKAASGGAAPDKSDNQMEQQQ